MFCYVNENFRYCILITVTLSLFNACQIHAPITTPPNFVFSIKNPSSFICAAYIVLDMCSVYQRPHL